MENDKIYCFVCDSLTNYTIKTFCRYHLKKHHNIDSETYYNLYIKKISDNGKCKTCGDKTKFKNINDGYGDFCSGKCSLKNKETHKKIDRTRKNNDLKKYGKWYQQTEEYKLKAKKTKKEKYGNENYCNKEKIKKTCLEKYGVDNFSKTKKFRNIMENAGIFIPLNKKTEFEKYRMLVFNETRKWIKPLFKKWDGNDYYTKEKLLTDPKKYNHPKYRTVDHKVSIYHGFIYNILPEKIGNINNLCICSRANNSKKKHKSCVGGKEWVQEIEVDFVVS